MKSILLTLLLSALAVTAQDRYVTVTLPVVFGSPNDYYPKFTTNVLDVAVGETAHLVALLKPERWTIAPSVYVQKDGVVAVGYSSERRNYSYYAPADPLVVNGPAKLLVAGDGGAMATFKITPDQYPPDKTVVVPGGAGGASVTLESSTNLVHWTPAASGAYTNLPGVKFFRIKLDRIQP